MSSATPELVRNCRRCSNELPPLALVCSQCHALVHGEELSRLSEQARVFERQRKIGESRAVWERCLPLLPADAKQADWIRSHLLDLKVEQEAPPPENQWIKRLGPLAPIAILLAKGKGLLAIFKVKFLFSFFAFLSIYWALYGAVFGAGFAALILVHEFGHYVDIKRRGLPAEVPVFLPGLGAYVRWDALGVSLPTRAAVSLAGPLAGWLASVVCAVVYWKTGAGVWAALAHTGAWLNVLNLVPVWVLDGSQATLALGKAERWVVLTACVALWALSHDGVFFLVAAGMVYRLFTKDLPQSTSRSTAAYFVIVLTLLAVIMVISPTAH